MTAAAVAVCAVVATVIAGGPAVAAPSAHRTHYYLSVGDSLAAGYQPYARGDVPGISYADQLYALLKRGDPGLVHVRLACSGESTTTMLDGGICAYPGYGAQLAAATAFLRQHRGQVTTVTLDIGANDVAGCFSAGSINTPCVTRGLATAARNVPRIADALRAAGGSTPVYVGATYYDPFLAAWLDGAAGERAARESVPMTDTLDGIDTAAMLGAGFRVANVAAAFSTASFKPVDAPGYGTLPENVAAVCRWTWMCTSYQDIHPNQAGHTVITNAVRAVLPGVDRR